MVDQSPADLGEVLRKREVVALREALKHWSPSAWVRVIADLSQRKGGFQ